jgi:hypothetical protein
MHQHAEPGKLTFGGVRQPRRQRGEQALGRLDHADLKVLVGVDAVEPVGQHLARRAVQLRGKLDPRRAAADDRDFQLLRTQRRGLRMRPHAGVHHADMEAPGVVWRLQLHRVVAHARGSEVVAPAADRDDQSVVAEARAGRDLPAGTVQRSRHMHLASLPIEAGHFPDAIAKAVPVRLRKVVDLVRPRVHAAGGDLVQLRLPDVGAVTVDERHVHRAADAVAKPGRELEAAGAAADDHDAVARRLSCVDGPGAAASGLRQPPGHQKRLRLGKRHHAERLRGAGDRRAAGQRGLRHQSRHVVADERAERLLDRTRRAHTPVGRGRDVPCTEEVAFLTRGRRIHRAAGRVVGGHKFSAATGRGMCRTGPRSRTRLPK